MRCWSWWDSAWPFLLIAALLGAAKAGGSLFNESNLLYVALIFYAGAGALYMGFGVTGTCASYVKFASIATAIGFTANTLAVAHRWYLAGRPPFASIYEMLLSFVWTVAALTLVTEKKFGVKIIGSITMPLAVVCVILMQLLPSEVRPLVPALQSTWLHVHVTLAMLSYAACAVSFALAMMFLIKDHFQTETFLAWTSAMVSAIYIAIVATRFEKMGRPLGHRMGRQRQERHFPRPRRAAVRHRARPGMAVRHGSRWRALFRWRSTSSAACRKNESYLRHRQQGDVHRHSAASRRAGRIRSASSRCQLRIARSRKGFIRPPWQPVAVLTRWHGDGHLRFPALPDAAVAAYRPGRPASQSPTRSIASPTRPSASPSRC